MVGDESSVCTKKEKGILEALLFTAEEPVPLARLGRYLNLSPLELLELLSCLSRDYQERQSGIQITRIGEGVRLETRLEMAPHIQDFHHPPKHYSLTPPTLETLAIIAYRQPITRGEIEAIRGVKVEKSLLTLKRYALIEEKGRLEAPGKPILYGTGEAFLAHFGLQDLSELPPLEEEPGDGAPGEEGTQE